MTTNGAGMRTLKASLLGRVFSYPRGLVGASLVGAIVAVAALAPRKAPTVTNA